MYIRHFSFFLRTILFSFLLGFANANANAAEESIETQQAFISVMDGYLDLSRDVVDIAAKRETTVFLAIEGIVEIYEARNDMDRAIEHLERIMIAYPDNLVIRNLVRFKLKDIYVETGRADKALEVLDALIAENKG